MHLNTLRLRHGNGHHQKMFQNSLSSTKIYISIKISLTFNNYPSLVQMMAHFTDAYIDGLVRGCIMSIANAQETLQSCTKPLICGTPSR